MNEKRGTNFPEQPTIPKMPTTTPPMSDIYCWHCLQKDPKDLPPVNEPVVELLIYTNGGELDISCGRYHYDIKEFAVYNPWTATTYALALKFHPDMKRKKTRKCIPFYVLAWRGIEWRDIERSTEKKIGPWYKGLRGGGMH